MKIEFLEKVVGDVRIMPVMRIAYSLDPVSVEKLVSIAKEMNATFGFELFDDMSETALRQDFDIITRAVAAYALR